MNGLPALMAIAALCARDLRAFLRSRSQLHSSLLFPLMLLAILGTGVRRGLEPASIRNGDYLTFLVPGIVVMTALFSNTFSSASYYQDRDSGVLKALCASPHASATILLGKSLAGMIIGSLQALAVVPIAATIPAVHLQWQYGVLPGVLAGVAATVEAVDAEARLRFRCVRPL